MSKLAIVGAAAVGYVLGARAGRERYEEIVSAAQRFARDPRVRDTASQAAATVREKAPEVGSAVAHAVQATASKVTGDSEDEGDVTTIQKPATSSA